MRKIFLLLATLILLCLAGAASAQECSSCDFPCEGPYGPNYECDYDGEGNYGQCTTRPNCRGCFGWFYAHCDWFAELAPSEPAPLLGVQKVTAVVVRHDPKPVTATYQIALSR